MSMNKDVFTCATCGETAHRDNADEMVFMNGDDVIHSISEQYPDWTHCICGECYDKQLDELQEQMEDERLQSIEVLSSSRFSSNHTLNGGI